MTKYLLCCLFILSGLTSSYSQQFSYSPQLIKRSNKITPDVTEKYTAVIGSDREIKQGQYQAFYKKKTPIAIGKYTDDKRTGTWQFFNKKGEPNQRYNYDTNTLQLETREDENSSMGYEFDVAITDTDRVTKPIKPGGRYYGYLPYLKCFVKPRDIPDEDMSLYYAVLELLISPGGRLAEFKIHLKTVWDESFDRILNVNPNRLFEDDKIFIPATVNRNPVSSQITINCHITGDNTIDIN